MQNLFSFSFDLTPQCLGPDQYKEEGRMSSAEITTTTNQVYVYKGTGLNLHRAWLGHWEQLNTCTARSELNTHTHTRTRIYLGELIYHTLPLTAFYLRGVKLHPGELTRFRHNSFPQQIRSLGEGNWAQRWTLLSRLLRNSVHTTRVCVFLHVLCVCAGVCTHVWHTHHQALAKPEPQRQSSKTATYSLRESSRSDYIYFYLLT